jgi:hypothetical protein
MSYPPITQAKPYLSAGLCGVVQSYSPLDRKRRTRSQDTPIPSAISAQGTGSQLLGAHAPRERTAIQILACQHDALGLWRVHQLDRAARERTTETHPEETHARACEAALAAQPRRALA